MIEYKQPNGTTYGLSYSELRESYLKYCGMSNKEFMEDLPGALHLACVICFLKEIPTYNCLNDEGIVHQIAHLLHIKDYHKMRALRSIRALFKRELKLA